MDYLTVTKSELARFNEIKALVRDGRPDLVSSADKQFVLDMLAKLNAKVNHDIVANAQAAGYNTDKLTIA